MASRPLIVIVGETASGKSALGLELAKKFEGEIISADSWNVYPGFDIGTAKPTQRDRQLVKHHLLDIADPIQGFSAAVYKRLANEAIDDILNRNKIPFLVGGTGLYVDAVIYNYGFLPKGQDARRKELNDKTLEELIKIAQEKDISLEEIDIRNKRRVIRAIESEGQKPVSKPMRPQTLIIGMKVTKDQLSNRISQRVDRMITAGLEDEVRILSSKLGWETEPMKGIGYQQWKEYFEGTQSLEQTRERIVKASSGLAKRQRTWFKRNQNIQWCEQPEQANKLVEHFLSNNLLQ